MKDALSNDLVEADGKMCKQKIDNKEGDGDKRAMAKSVNDCPTTAIENNHTRATAPPSPSLPSTF
eukprot:8321030-Ditylum_brightwellii.AAC.1